MRADPSDTLPPVLWPVLMGELTDAGTNAERILNAKDAEVSDLLAAARYRTLAATVNLLVEAGQNAVALAELIAAAEHRLLAAHEAATAAEGGL